MLFDRDKLFEIIGGGLVLGLGAGALAVEAGGSWGWIPAGVVFGALVAYFAVRE